MERLRHLDLADGNLAAFFLRIERDFLAFVQAAKARALQRRGMDEHVLAAIVGLNEAKALLAVVKLYGAGSHEDILSRLAKLASTQSEAPVR